VLYGLGSSEKASIKRRHSFEVLHDLGPLFRDTVDGGARLAPRGLADNLEDAVEPLNLAFRLAFMFDEGGPEFFGMRGFRHLGQRLQDLIFSEIDVFQGFVE
jgi:hypothetical protein